MRESALVLHRRVLDDPAGPGFLLVLGARRGGTSRLLRLLGEHPDILAAGSTGIRYRARADFAHLVAKVSEARGDSRIIPSCSWIADALSRNHALPDDPRPLLAGLRCRVIFVVRDPVEIASRLGSMPGYDPDEAARKTAERLRALAVLAGRLSGVVPILAINDERVAAREAELLDELKMFLGLTNPFPPGTEAGRQEDTGDSDEAPPSRPSSSGRPRHSRSSARVPPATIPDLRAAGATYALALGRIRSAPAVPNAR